MQVAADRLTQLEGGRDPALPLAAGRSLRPVCLTGEPLPWPPGRSRTGPPDGNTERPRQERRRNRNGGPPAVLKADYLPGQVRPDKLPECLPTSDAAAP